jgi:hypothetical protein
MQVFDAAQDNRVVVTDGAHLLVLAAEGLDDVKVGQQVLHPALHHDVREDRQHLVRVHQRHFGLNPVQPVELGDAARDHFGSSHNHLSWVETYFHLADGSFGFGYLPKLLDAALIGLVFDDRRNSDVFEPTFNAKLFDVPIDCALIQAVHLLDVEVLGKDVLLRQQDLIQLLLLFFIEFAVHFESNLIDVSTLEDYGCDCVQNVLLVEQLVV